MRRISAVDAGVSLAVLVLVAATLIPAVARIQRSPADARCQSNLRRWAEAMALYCADNNWCFPSNRPRLTQGFGVVIPTVRLSPDEIDPATSKPMRFVYGITWVEALYSYLWDAADRTGQDWKAFRRCPNARNITCPNIPVMPNACITYTFNRCLVEQPFRVIRDPKVLMMMREFSRLTISMLRPVNDSTGNQSSRPQDPFASGRDYLISGDITAECKLHGEGSYTVFADGHVRYFTLDYYPQTGQITTTNSWDPERMQWWNWGPGSGKSPPLLKSIAITP